MVYVLPNPLSPRMRTCGLAEPLLGSGFQKTSSPVSASEPRRIGESLVSRPGRPLKAL